MDVDNHESTREAIMQATLRELRERGIRNLTVKSVAISSNVVPSVVIYHYKTKDGLLLACANCFGSVQGRLTDELADILKAGEDPFQTFEKFVALCLSRAEEARVLVELQMYLQLVHKTQTQEIWQESLRSFDVLAPIFASRFAMRPEFARALVHQLSVLVVRLTTMESSELAEVYECPEPEARAKAFSFFKETLLLATGHTPKAASE